MTDYDFIIVGAGIIGLATAIRLQERNVHAKIVIIEKEDRVSAHQSGHNSGVIHAGVYYEPGSLKARLCREGLKQTIAFCTHYDIPFRQCGKLIVATSDTEAARLAKLGERAHQNGAEASMVNADQLVQLEPNVAGVGALHVPQTGIVDYAAVCRKMAEIVTLRGGAIALNARLIAIREKVDAVHVDTTAGAFRAKQLIACAGLQSDRVAKLAGMQVDFAIVPFRGDFYRLAPQRADVVKHLIYPVPDPLLPFLGVHLTATIDGSMTVGPSAMLALHREAYKKFAVSAKDLAEMFRYRGLWRLLARYPGAGVRECVYGLSRLAYLRAVQKYCPVLKLSDLGGHQCGVRAQAVTRDGRLIHDFLIKRTARTTHICNAPSPAATAALPIADSIVEGLTG